MQAWKFDPDQRRWSLVPSAHTHASVPINSNHIIDSQTISLVTYNVWFSTSHSYDDRNHCICRLLGEIRASIICLQEVRPAFLEILKSQDWVRSHYYISDASPDGRTLKEYGVLMLSKYQPISFTFYSLPSSMNRNVYLVGQFVLKNGYGESLSLRVGTLHLDSKKSAAMRDQQLAKISSYTNTNKKYDIDIIMGDFNICSSWSENTETLQRYFNPSEWRDLWRLLVPHTIGENGKVEENEQQWWWSMNPLRNRNLHDKLDQPPVRFDRIFLRAGSEHAPQEKLPITVEVTMIGTNPISQDPSSPLSRVWPSDHFGLCARIRLALVQKKPQ